MEVTRFLRRVDRRTLLRTAAVATAMGLATACAAPPAPAPTTAPAPAGGQPAAPAAKAPGSGQPLAGLKMKLLMTTIDYADGLTAKASEFTKATGAELEVDQQAFAVLNQRADLELSSGSGAYDVIQMIYIRTGRWMAAGWVEPLEPLMNDPGADPKGFDVQDFAAGAIAPMKFEDKLYAIPWLSDSTIVGYRKDAFEKAGIAVPDTFDALETAAQKMQTPDRSFFVTENNLHWIYPNWLQSYGGNFFADPPKDLTPTFNTPEAITSADKFVTMLTKYSPKGSPNLEPTACQTSMYQNKSIYFFDGLGNTQPIIDKTKTDYADFMAFGKSPSGPKGYFPQLAVHGFCIPKGAKNKKASWELIRWATSKEMFKYQAMERVHLSGSRTSVLSDPEVKKKYTWQGSDLTDLHLAVMKRAGDGYMAYRTVPQFPAVGNSVIIALGSICSGQAKTADAMKTLQADAEGIMEKEGVKIRKS